jgi:hypothetical protein
MNIKLDMPIGAYRELSKDEFIELNRLISNSTKEYIASTTKRKE